MKNITTDSQALDYRIYVHNHFSKADFDGWAMNRLKLKKGLRVLDVGCGSGKHLFEIAKQVGPQGKILGQDIDTTSLEKCRQKINELNATNVEVVQADLTELSEKILHKKFDRILSSFAIYYTKNPEKTFRDCDNLLGEKGLLFICGPTKKNNLEYLELVKRAGGTFSEDFNHWSKFLEDAAQGILKKLFKQVHVEYFNNPVEFPDEKTLLKYWRATPLYNKSMELRMRKLITKEFATKKKFTSNKIIIGITCKKT